MHSVTRYCMVIIIGRRTDGWGSVFLSELYEPSARQGEDSAAVRQREEVGTDL